LLNTIFRQRPLTYWLINGMLQRRWLVQTALTITPWRFALTTSMEMTRWVPRATAREFHRIVSLSATPRGVVSKTGRISRFALTTSMEMTRWVPRATAREFHRIVSLSATPGILLWNLDTSRQLTSRRRHSASIEKVGFYTKARLFFLGNPTKKPRSSRGFAFAIRP